MDARPPRWILVTGATGFIGHATIPALRARFPEAVLGGLARSERSEDPPGHERQGMGARNVFDHPAYRPGDGGPVRDCARRKAGRDKIPGP